MSKISNKINIENRRARFEYQIIETYVAGIVLKGTEIKSIRESKAALSDSYCQFVGNELFIRNMHIAEYTDASFYQHSPTRERKLLLSKQELSKLMKKVNEGGLTIIPLKLFITDKGFAKVEIALCKGKKLHDKREDIKKKDIERELGRRLK
ncbi:MAG: SsrA-binding protein SmpB [Bacteroidia bacterium]